jgi:hypothetical protein
MLCKARSRKMGRYGEFLDDIGTEAYAEKRSVKFC